MTDEHSRDLYDRALSVMPGGVNSAVRAAIEPYPFFVDHGDGGHIIDVDDNRYIDWVMGLGPLLLGHELPDSVMAAVQQRTSEGPMYAAPTPVEVELAEFVARHVPSVEQVRFVNSGTEATVSAVRLARGCTGRDKLVVMQGGYHGAQDSTLVAGSADAPRPSSPGVPQSFAAETIPVPFNDEAALEAVFDVHGPDIAAVLTEPILANTGIVHPVDGYLDRVRELTAEHGALLILDEVITGFRVGGLGGAQQHFDITPDLTTFGKVVGGGFPVGAIGGPANLMEEFTPAGDVFQAGTFSGHPVTMAAGLETLRYAAEHDIYDQIDTLGEQLRSGLADILADEAPSYTVAGSHSMFKVIFTRDGTAPRTAADVEHAQTDRWRRIFWGRMREEGVFLSQNQFEAQFVSAAHTTEDVEETLEAYKEAL